MKTKSILTVLALSALAADAGITVVTQTDFGVSNSYGNGTADGTDTDTIADGLYFANVTVQPGDILVVAHANNKRTDNNIISMTVGGGNVVQSLSSGSSGTTSGAWVFWSQITVGGTYNILLDTSNITKTVAQASSLFVFRPGAGETLAVAATDGSVATGGVTSLSLDFSMSPLVTGAYAVGAAAVNTSSTLSGPAGWFTEITTGTSPAIKRGICSNNNINGTALSAAFGSTTATDMALAGIVVKTIAPASPVNDGTWISTNSGNWTDDINWAGGPPGVIANGSGFTADFSTINPTADLTVTLNGSRTIGNLIFADTDTSSAAGWTVTGDTLILVGTTPTITVGTLGTSKVVTIGSVLAGASGLTKAGAGTLELTNQNTLAGTVTVNEGTVLANGSGSANGTLGAASLVIGGTGQVTVGGDNSLVGTATTASRTIRLNAGGTLLNPGSSSNRLHALVMDGGTLSANTADPVSGNWNFDYGVSTPGTASASYIAGGNAALTQTGGTVFNIGAGDTLTVGTQLEKIGSTADTGLIKRGSGTLVLGGTNNYQAATKIEAGTLKLATGGSIPDTASITVTSGAVLDAGETGLSLGAGQILTAGNQSSDDDVVGGLASAGTIRPGGNGTVGTVTGITNLTLGGSLYLDLDLPNNNCDKFEINGSLAIAPGFVVEFNPIGTTALPTAPFTVVSGITGLAGAANLPAISGFQWDYTTAPTELRLVRTVANLLWKGFSDSLWNTSSVNWDKNGSSAAYSEADNTTFDDTASGTGEVIVNLAGDVTPGLVVVSNNSRDYTIRIDNSVTGFAGIIGNASLTKSGAGLLTLLTDNAYTGGTAVNSGTLAFGSGCLGTSGSITVGGGALRWHGANTQDLSARLVMVAGKSAAFDTNGNSVTFASAIGGSTTASLVKLGEGTLILSAINTYTGGTTVNAGTLAFSSSGLGTSGTVTMNGGALRWETNNVRDLSSRLVLVSGKPAILETNGTSLDVTTFGSSIGGGTTASLVKRGASILTLSAANTFTGGVSVENGSLELANDLAAGANTITMSAPDTVGAFSDLRFSGTNALTISNPLVISDAGQVKRLRKFGSGVVSYAGNITVNETTEGLFEIQVGNGNTLTITGNISDTGTGGIEKINPGNLILQGAKTYTGPTMVTGGTLTLDTAFLADTSSVKVGTGAVLNLTHGATDTVDKLFINGVQQPAGTYRGTGSSGDGTVLTELGTSTGKLLVTTGPAGYDSWKTAITNGLNARNQDADGDGLLNIQEFLFGTDPMAGNQPLATVEKSGSNLIIRWKQRISGAAYTLLQGTTLNTDWITATGATLENDGPASGDYQPRKATIPIGAGNQFYRVEGIEN